MDIEQAKKEAGIAAVQFVESGMHVGLGTGSTVKHTVIEIGRAIQEDGLEVIGVPTSIETENLAIEHGIPLSNLTELGGLDLVIDGADEFDPEFNLIKGGGAALLREKIVAQASNRMIVVADDRKRVERLGAFPLPIEITPFEWEDTLKRISLICGVPANLRVIESNGPESPLITDNGNMIVDAGVGDAFIDNPALIESQLLHLAGVVEVGLFIDMCDTVVLAGQTGVEILHRSDE
ncbi:MAG TPA: ribose-5-phosphate isomerase RpiA [Candidatus Thalassarchaeaceae archaeon]|nr:MAG TPA: ribose-5-phosphate isomerase RpiA [Candidatus Poseidoniales archaeon]HII48958.1 ribose-5-phosphate isomerase RpiA [Candidatus Thalassarchaeaceae archaeon]